MDFIPDHLAIPLFCALVGFFAGGVRATVRDSQRPMRDVLIQAVSSAFVAFLVAEGMFAAGQATDSHMVVLVSGLAAWIGTAVLDRLASLVMSKVFQSPADSSTNQPSKKD